MPIVIALKVPNPLSWLRVRGRLKRKQRMAEIALNPMVHQAELVKVFNSFAPTKQCSAIQ
jgi:hypothetical protein